MEQGHYGHVARKATWLYAAGVSTLPSLVWGPCRTAARIDGAGFHTSAERRALLGDKSRAEWLRDRGVVAARTGRRENAATPLAFRDLLLSIARGARAPRALRSG